jgi:hypothetical protein
MEPLRSRIFFFNHTLMCYFLIKKSTCSFHNINIINIFSYYKSYLYLIKIMILFLIAIFCPDKKSFQ